MKNTEFKFRINVTLEGYSNKQDAQACLSSAGAKAINRSKMAFKENELTVSEFLDLAIKGHAFCSLYQYDATQKYWITNKKGQKYFMFPEYQRGTNKGAMKVCFKRDEFFKGSQAVFVDVDFTKFQSVEEYINSLEFKPTAVYMSFSDKKEKHEIVSRRFHMVYIFNEILNKDEFEAVSKAITLKAEIDTNEPMDDDCGTRCSQYMNGCYGNSEVYKTDIIYSYNDFIEYINIYNKNNINNNKVEDVDNNTTTYYIDLQKNEHLENEVEVDVNDVISESEPEDLISKSLVSDMSRLDYDEFMKYNRHKYPYFYRVEKDEWIDNTYQYIDENYFSLYWNVVELRDGQKRKKKCFERMCLRRVINPEVDADTLLFNAYEDVHRFFNNEDGDLGMDYLVRNVTNAMSLTIEEIKEKYSDNIQYLKSKAPKSGIILKRGVALDIADRNKKLKEIRYSILDAVYDTSLSLQDNLRILNDSDFKICEKSLYNYCNERGYITNTKKEDRDAEILSVYDFNLSLRKNLQAIKEMGIKVSLGKLSMLVKEYKNNNSNIVEDNSTTYYNDLQNIEQSNKDENLIIKDEPDYSILPTFTIPEIRFNLDAQTKHSDQPIDNLSITTMDFGNWQPQFKGF